MTISAILTAMSIAGLMAFLVMRERREETTTLQTIGNYCFLSRNILGLVKCVGVYGSIIDDSRAKQLLRFRFLREVCFGHTSASAHAVAQVAERPRVRLLAIYEPRFGDEAIREISARSKAKHLEIERTAISPACFPVLADSRHLSFLRLPSDAAHWAGLSSLIEQLPCCQIQCGDLVATNDAVNK
jgi:hypothetical protein